MYRLGVFLPVKGDYYTEAVVKYLKEQDNFEVVFFNEVSNLRKKTNKKWTLGKFLFSLQLLLERLIFPKYSNPQKELTEFIDSVSSLHTFRKGIGTYLDADSIEYVKSLKLDLGLRLGFGILRGEILTIPKAGIWSFHHGDSRTLRGSPVGFWECCFKTPTISVTLQKINDSLDGGVVVGKSETNRHFSMLVNRRKAYDLSIALLKKEMSCFPGNNILPVPPYDREMLKISKLGPVIVYLRQFYHEISKKVLYRFLQNISIYPFHWELAIVEGDPLKARYDKFNRLTINRNSFSADPFAISLDNKTWIFYESYPYSSMKGKIDVGYLNELGELVHVGTALEKETHLSYPFLLKDGDDIYMIPESSEDKSLVIYKSVDFPLKWEVYDEGFKGESIIDCVVYRESNDNYWWFLNKKTSRDINDTELFIYNSCDLSLKNLKAHARNPVIINSTTGRNGGDIFMHDGDLVRTSQVNIDGVYGKAIAFNRIKLLNLEEYQEELIDIIRPNFDKNLVGLHHLSRINGDSFIIDVCYNTNF